MLSSKCIPGMSRLLCVLGIAAASGACAPTAPGPQCPESTRALPCACCLSVRGCRSQLLPPCSTEVRTAQIAVQEVERKSEELVGQRISVGGTFRAGTPGCTAAGCRPGDCCNTCEAALAIVEGNAPQHAIVVERMICWGDDSRVCCPYGEQQPVIVTGTLRRHPVYLGQNMQGSSRAEQILTLEPASVCSLEPTS
jgi:hypothetical protein